MGATKRGHAQAGDLAAIRNLSDDDPARALIAEIVSVVPVSHWSFARLKSDGGFGELLLPGAPGTQRRENLNRLKAEFVLQRERSKKGPRLSPTLGPLPAAYVSGITLVFASHRTDLGILSLLRNERLGPFTSAELRTLALALDSSADRLSGFPLVEFEGSADEARPAPFEPGSAMYVLDQRMRIVLTWKAPGGHKAAITHAHAFENRLPPIIERAVAELVSHWKSDAAGPDASVARPVPFLLVRAQQLTGPSGVFIGVILERVPGANALTKAADTFSLSPRELQTLALLIEGASLTAVGKTMNITASTVQDHIRNMLEKTGSKNRSEMIAKIVGMQPEP